MAAVSKRSRPVQVIGPLGERLTIDSLPPAGTTRWVARRKAEVLAAVKGGLLSVEEACERYDLSLEEFIHWQRAIERSGVPGLRVKSVQRFRSVISQGASKRSPIADPQPNEPLHASQKLPELA
jgi:hypothetical protein